MREAVRTLTVQLYYQFYIILFHLWMIVSSNIYFWLTYFFGRVSDKFLLRYLQRSLPFTHDSQHHFPWCIVSVENLLAFSQLTEGSVFYQICMLTNIRNTFNVLLWFYRWYSPSGSYEIVSKFLSFSWFFLTMYSFGWLISCGALLEIETVTIASPNEICLKLYLFLKSMLNDSLFYNSHIYQCSHRMLPRYLFTW